MIKTTLAIVAIMLFITGCTTTISLNLLANRSSGAANTGEGEAWSETKPEGGGTIGQDAIEEVMKPVSQLEGVKRDIIIGGKQ